MSFHLKPFFTSGKTVLIKELIHNVYSSVNANAVFVGIGERTSIEAVEELKKTSKNLIGKSYLGNGCYNIVGNTREKTAKKSV